MIHHRKHEQIFCYRPTTNNSTGEFRARPLRRTQTKNFSRGRTVPFVPRCLPAALAIFVLTVSVCFQDWEFEAKKSWKFVQDDRSNASCGRAPREEEGRQEEQEAEPTLLGRTVVATFAGRVSESTLGQVARILPLREGQFLVLLCWWFYFCAIRVEGWDVFLLSCMVGWKFWSFFK